MKKSIVISIILTFVSILSLGIFALVETLNDKTVTWYPRFYTIDSTGSKQFNYLGLLSPIQVESQEPGIDAEVTLYKKVIYPYGKGFKCISPVDKAAEARAAREMADVIRDTIHKTYHEALWDYDQQSFAVREAQNPQTIFVPKPEIHISLTGTASCESRKDGFKESIQLMHFEPENQKLAEDRLIRTKDSLLKYLQEYHIDGVKIDSMKAEELQLSLDQYSLLLDNPTENLKILDDMRFVKAVIPIKTHRVKIKTATSPILLIPWLWLTLGVSILLCKLIYFLFGLRIPKFEPSPKMDWHWDWSWFWKLILLIIALLMFLGTLLWLIYNLYWVFLGIMAIIGLLAVLWCLLQIRFFNGIYSLWRCLLNWWRSRTTCQKILFIHVFVIDLYVLVTYLLGYWTIC